MYISDVDRSLDGICAGAINGFKIRTLIKCSIEDLKALGCGYLNSFKIIEFAECIFTYACDGIGNNDMLNIVSNREPRLIL